MRAKVASLTAYAKNPRLHSPEQVQTIANSMREFGQTQLVVVDDKGEIICGHGRILAAELLGWTQVMVGVAVGWTDEQKRACRIADNQTALTSTWDFGLLGGELMELRTEEFDLGVLGFSDIELNDFWSNFGGDAGETKDEMRLPKVAVSRPGDIWHLGLHRLACADSRDKNQIELLMEDGFPAVCFTSPPYAQARDYITAKDMVADWDGLMRGVFAALRYNEETQVLVNLGLVHADAEWQPYFLDWIEWMRSEGWKRFGWYIWDKGNGLPGEWNGRLCPSHEFVFHFTRGSVPSARKITRAKTKNARMSNHNFRNKDGSLHSACSPHKVGQDWRVPDSVIRINAARGQKTGHPAVFSVPFAEFVLNTWSKPGQIVYDPFAGAGTTIIAAENLGRVCRAAEVDPIYTDVSIMRWQEHTNTKALLNGRAFDIVAEERQAMR